MRRTEKEMDLLSAYYRKNEPSKYEPILKLVAFPLCVALLLGGVTVFAKLETSSVNAQISEVDKSIDEYNEKISNVGTGDYENLATIQADSEELSSLISNIQTYPKFTSDTINIFLNRMGSGTSITYFDFDNGVMSVQFMSGNVLSAEQLVRDLRNSGNFVNVSYTGYETQQQTYTSENTTNTEEGTSENSTSTQNNSVTVSTYVYSVDCVLKGGE